MLKKCFYVMCFFCCLNASSQTALDLSFGTSGYADIKPLNGKDGKFIILLQNGNFMNIGNSLSNLNHFVISRHYENGRLDSSYGYMGLKNIVFQDGNSYTLHTAVVTEDSMLILGLSCYNPSFKISSFVLLKTYLDGSRDSTFGKNGIVNTPESGAGYIQALNGLIIDKNKNILLSFSRQYNSEIRRYKANGEADTLFQNKGELQLDTTVDVWVQNLTLTGDNHYLISYIKMDNWRSIIVEARDSNGNIIANDSLKSKLDFTHNEMVSKYYFGLLKDKDENIFSCFCYGDISNTPPFPVINTRIRITKYNKWGNSVKSFGINGVVDYKVCEKKSWNGINQIRLDRDNRIVFGFSYIDSTFMKSNGTAYDKYKSKIYRLTARGNLDSTFNNKGYFDTFKDSANSVKLNDIAVRNDNKIMVAGAISDINGGMRPLICRFNAMSPNTSVRSFASNRNNIHSTYPSPFYNTITISDLSGPCSYRIYNIHGQLMDSGHSENSTIEHLEDLPAGMYVLLIQNGQQQFVLKVVKG